MDVMSHFSSFRTPAVKPEIKYFCSDRNKIEIGIAINTEPAATL